MSDTWACCYRWWTCSAWWSRSVSVVNDDGFNFRPGWDVGVKLGPVTLWVWRSEVFGNRWRVGVAVLNRWIVEIPRITGCHSVLITCSHEPEAPHGEEA